jgi:hypothetical protein
MMRRLPTLPLLALVGVAAGAAPLEAQSLLSSRGFGLVVDPVDARSGGLGGAGLGLFDVNLSLVNPASIAGLPAPALVSSFRFDSFSATVDGASTSGGTARFPLLHAAAPLGERWAVSLGYGALVDQTWGAQVATPDTLAGEAVTYLDRFESRGGIGRFRFGAAYQAGARFAAGLGLDLYTGLLQRQFSRGIEGSFDNTLELREWSYSGLGYSGGVRWTPSEALTLAAAVNAGGTVRAESADTATTPGSADYALPLRAHLGGSAIVGQNTMVALAGEYAGWSSLAGDLGAGAGPARDTWTVQGGVEWSAITVRERPLPLRVGGRYRQLPFGFDESAGMTERALTAGAGLRLAGGAANLDVSLERGWRGGQPGFDEGYWRTMLSLNVLGR